MDKAEWLAIVEACPNCAIYEGGTTEIFPCDLHRLPHGVFLVSTDKAIVIKAASMAEGATDTIAHPELTSPLELLERWQTWDFFRDQGSMLSWEPYSDTWSAMDKNGDVSSGFATAELAVRGLM